MSGTIHVDEEQLFLMLGEYALPATGDCAPVAQELIRRVRVAEWISVILEDVIPYNWYVVMSRA